MKSVPLTAYPRTLARRGGSKKLRSSGRIPAVVYGGQSKPENLLVDLAIDKDANPKRLALVKEVQHYALTGKVLHIDFHEISPTEKVTVMVPVECTGEAVGVKTGG